MGPILRSPDLRWWWTAALAAALLVWIVGIASGLAFLDEPDAAVFARIAFLRDHGEIALAEQVGVWAMVAAAVAIATHLLWALALHSHGITPLLTSVVVALAGMVMVPALAAFAVGMTDLPGVHLTRWFFVLLGSGVAVAVGGVQLWRIALDDRRREQTERVFLARSRLEGVHRMGGKHADSGASEG